MELSLMNPIIIGILIGLICVCCLLCFGCIYCKCTRKSGTSNSSTTQHTSYPRRHKRTHSDLAAIETMKHNQALVRTWLKHELSLDQYYSSFIENGYGSMRAIKSIKDKQELVDIGITKKGHQTLIMSNIELMQRAQKQQNSKPKYHQKKGAKHAVIDERKAFNESLVAEWLEHSCNLLQYFPLFIQNGYDSINIIKRIRDPSQIRDMGIKKQGHVFLILSEIQNLQNRRKTIDQHVDQVYIEINKAQYASNSNKNTGEPIANAIAPGKYPHDNNQYHMKEDRQKMRIPQQYAMNIQQYDVGPGAIANQPLPSMPNLPNLPDAFSDTLQDDNVDDLFGTMQSNTAYTQSTTLGIGAVTQEVIDGQFYNVTKPTDGETLGFTTNPNRVNQ